jgi:orotate phosphoribosyltransferase
MQNPRQSTTDEGKSRCDFLYQCIQERVFVPASKERSVTPDGRESEWLFDFRQVTLLPAFIDTLAEEFWERFKELHPFQVGGVEVAAVPIVAAIVMKSVQKGQPVNGFFIRKSRKKSGLLRMVEGQIGAESIILVDDLMHTGASLLRQVEIIERLGKKVHTIFTILRFRDESCYAAFEERGIAVVSLFALNDFSRVLPVKNLTPVEMVPVPRPFRVRWRFAGARPNFFYVLPKSRPALDERCLYFGIDQGLFVALDRLTGQEVWTYRVLFGSAGKYIFSSPALWRDLVFFGAYDGNLYALDRTTGKRVWVFSDADWIGSSPAVAADLGIVFIGLEFGLFRKQGGVAAVAASTGKKIWSYSLPGLTHASPAYSAKFGMVVCGSNDGSFSAWKATTGVLFWQVKTGGPIRYGAAFDEARGLVFVGSEDGLLYAIAVQTGTIVYTYPVGFGMYSTPLVVGDIVIAASLDKNVYGINAVSGVERWRFTTRGRIFASPVLYRGSIYVGSNDGCLYELDPQTGKNTAVFQATERITNAVVADERTGDIFLPTFANEVYCLKRTEDSNL